MQIKTAYMAPTNNRGAYVKASGFGRTTSMAWDHFLSGRENHAAAARELCRLVGEDAKGKWYATEGTDNAMIFFKHLWEAFEA